MADVSPEHHSLQKPVQGAAALTRWLKEPMGQAALAAGLLFLVVAAASLAAGYDVDSVQYFPLYEGRYEEAASPFRTRLLAPLVVQWLAPLFTLGGAAILFTAVSGALFTFLLNGVLKEIGVEPALRWTACLSSALALAVTQPWMPDMASMALTMALIAFRLRPNPWLFLPAAFAAGFARESVLLLLLVLAGFDIAGRRKEWWMSAAGLLFAAAGMAAASRAAGPGETIHGAGGPLYMLLKLPANGLRNLAGVAFWVESYRDMFPAPPDVLHELPKWLQFGRNRSIGFYPPSLTAPFTTLVCVLGAGGMALILRLAGGRSMLKQADGPDLHLLRALSFYSLACLALAPFLGTSVYRLAYYAWPLFLVAAPWMIQNWPGSPRERGWLAAIHAGISGGCGLFVAARTTDNLALMAASALAMAGLAACGWKLAKAAARKAPRTTEAAA